MIFLLIQGSLLLLGDMTMVLGSHIPFFLPDLMIFMVQTSGFGTTHLSVIHFAVNAGVLICQSAIDFSPAGMVLCPGATVGKSSICKK